METSTVPVTGDGLGCEGDLDSKLLGNAVEAETRHPELISNCIAPVSSHSSAFSKLKLLTVNAVARTDLVLPLCRHDLGVGSRDVDTSVQAGLVVCLDNVTAEDLSGTDTAVVRTLGSGETVLGPAVRPAVNVKESVLLLKAKPELVAFVGLHKDSSIMTEVVGVGLSVAHPGLAHDENVRPATEWVVVDGDWAEVDIRVVTRCLTS